MSKTSNKSVSKALGGTKPKATKKMTKRAVSKSPAVRKKTSSTTSKKTQRAKVTRSLETVTRKPAKSKVHGKVTRTKAQASTTKPKTSTNAKSPRTTKKSTARKPASKKVATKKKLPIGDAEVALPTRMSIRAREKALVMADAFEKDFYRAAVVLSKTGALAFILLGSLITYSQFDYLRLFDRSCGDEGCFAAVAATSKISNVTQKIQPTSFVELLTDVPDVIDTPLGIPVQVSSIAGSPQAYIRSLSDSGANIIEVNIESIGNNKFEVYIDPQSLAINRYELVVEVVHENTQKPTVYSLGNFAVAEAASAVDAAASIEQINAGTDQATNTTQTKPKIIGTQSTSQKQTADLESVKLSNSAAVDPENQNEKSNVEALDQSTVDSTIGTVTSLPKSKPVDPIQIATEAELSGIASVLIENNGPREMIKFYISPVQSLNRQSIGQLIPGTQTFKFDSRQFPNGQYQLYAQSDAATTNNLSNTASFTITNELTDSKLQSTNVPSNADRELLDVIETISASNIRDMQESEGTTTHPKSVIDSESIIPADRAQDGGDQIEVDGSEVLNLTRNILLSDSDTINELFRRYAVAQQSSDEILIQEAQRAIDTYKSRRVEAALNDQDSRLFASELSDRLNAELGELTNKVQVFESVRRERSESKTSIDTDGDGISDFDEVTLFSTDPSQADSDSDGFTDGAEIISGFNPNDSAPEAAIMYQSPKETVGIIYTERLQILEVAPEIDLSTNMASSSVRAVVSGKALPNSFVTLYVYSTPTIVTVKTDAEGLFEYTFSTELEDGQHEVFVALTDNTGAIVAQSQPYTFVKVAQAFTPVDANAVTPSVPVSDTGNQSVSYQIAIGMSVLALGILLLLLGFGLKSNKPEVVINTKQPA